ncbi:putative cytochrome P450 [Helianthus annuus]|nr:putative cytochrome P450 [Helianthus annuus]
MGENNYNLIILSLSLLTLSTFFYRLTRRGYSTVKTPCPQSYPLIGNLIGFLRNRHRYHDWVTDMLSASPTLTFRVNGFLGLSQSICTADPTNIEYILESDFRNYIKSNRYTSVMQELLGSGIFNSNGLLWASHRKITGPEFAVVSLKTFISDSVQSQLSKSLIPLLLSAGSNTFDLQHVLRKFSFDTICNVVFGADPCISFVQAFDEAVEHTSNRFISPFQVVWKLKRFFNIGDERKYKETIKTLNQFAMDVIDSKDAQNGCETDRDLLSRFIVFSLDMGFEDEERRNFLRDTIINFVFASKDPTSTALTWFFWLLDGHPHCKHMIHKELSMLTTSSPDIHPLNLTFDDLKSLNYLHAALSESMRLFPPVPINSRSTVDDDILPDGTYVRKGWFVDYSVYAMGRMESLWGCDCREFKPERWLNDNGVYQQAYDPFGYPVFNGGLRLCMGKDLAYFQMKLVVVAVMHEFEIEVVGGGGTPERMEDPPYSLSLLLNMKNGLPVRVKKRQQVAPVMLQEVRMDV